MNNRTNKYAFLTLLAAGLASCTSEDFWDTFDRTIDGPINLTVGIESSPAQRAMTRGEGDPTYYAMQTGSQVRLKVDGKWNGKQSEDISQQATCKTEALTPTANSLTYDAGQTLYWDDYGAGDPANKEYNDKGLSVLGVAVDGETEAPAPENGKWDALAWSTVDNDGKAEVNSSTHLLKKDIIVSNNLSAFKFAERKTTGEMNFKHPLCKITFNIKAGAGFPNTGVGATDIKFAKDPILTLSKATTLAGVSESSNNYALTTGTINIKEGTATANTTPAKVIAATTSTSDKDITVIKQALVYPDTPLGASDDAVIAVLQADDNVYYIKAKEIHDKMTGHTNFKTKAGYNYIINIIVNKSGIQLTATVTDWNKVNSDEVHPIINVNATVGDGGTNPTKENTFAFYRSENIEKDYEKAASPKVKTDGTMDWTGTTILYWSSHYQHYHFRGIYPETTGVEKDADDKHQYIKVTNGEYNANTFPSNFVIGMPEIASGTLCGNKDHTQVDMSIYGICAREAFINMNFRYMMSQVEVVLSSSESTSKNYVDVTNAVVELVNVYNSGNILLKDRTAEVTGTADKFTLPISDAGEHKYLGVIVPQELTYSTAGASTNVRIKITVTNTDNTKDIYYADVNPIYKKGTTDLIAPNGKWESGVHYVYNLKVTKTEIMATASLTDWSKVEAEENVWF